MTDVPGDIKFLVFVSIVMSVEEICFKFSKTVHLVSRLNCIELLLLGTDQWSKLLTPHIFNVHSVIGMHKPIKSKVNFSHCNLMFVNTTLL